LQFLTPCIIGKVFLAERIIKTTLHKFVCIFLPESTAVRSLQLPNSCGWRGFKRHLSYFLSTPGCSYERLSRATLYVCLSKTFTVLVFSAIKIETWLPEQFACLIDRFYSTALTHCRPQNLQEPSRAEDQILADLICSDPVRLSESEDRESEVGNESLRIVCRTKHLVVMFMVLVVTVISPPPQKYFSP